tara:strand:- start:14 stop:298 length:285 start_codon:yes stop_codon:yes gene_type:complete
MLETLIEMEDAVTIEATIKLTLLKIGRMPYEDRRKKYTLTTSFKLNDVTAINLIESMLGNTYPAEDNRTDDSTYCSLKRINDYEYKYTLLTFGE